MSDSEIGGEPAITASLDAFFYVSVGYGEFEAYSYPFTIFEAIFDPGYPININVDTYPRIIPSTVQSCSITRKAAYIRVCPRSVRWSSENRPRFTERSPTKVLANRRPDRTGHFLTLAARVILHYLHSHDLPYPPVTRTCLNSTKQQHTCVTMAGRRLLQSKFTAKLPEWIREASI